MDFIELFRPVGDAELALIRDSGWSSFPPRLPDQPIFYPVLEEDYAIQIARDWNTRDGGRGYVLKFQVDRQYLSRYEVQTVGTRIHREYWIPAEDLTEFNRNILGTIEVIHSFGEEKPDEVLNERLTASSIPPVTASWQTIVRFALTMDGYKAIGQKECPNSPIESGVSSQSSQHQSRR